MLTQVGGRGVSRCVDEVKPRPAVEAFVLALMEATTNLGTDGRDAAATPPANVASECAGIDAPAD